MTDATEERLLALGYALPEAPLIAAGYQPKFAPYVISDRTIYVSGRLAKRGNELLAGRVGEEISLAEAQEAAAGVSLEIVAILKKAVGNLDRIGQISRLFVMVRGAEAFDDPHKVADGASEVFASIFGDRGIHARSAMSALNLPFGACIEVDIVAQLQGG